MLYKDFIQQIILERGQWGLDVNTYKEMHHIVPVCLGGQGDLDTNLFKKNSHHENCIWLTAYEHFIAHKLLMEEHPESAELKLAYCAMILWKSTDQQRDYEVSAQEYEQARLMANEINKELHTGKVYSEETIEKRRKKMTGQKRTEETKRRISTATKAFYKTESEEHRKARIQHVSESTKQAMWEQDTRKKYLEAYYSDEARAKQKAGVRAFYESEAGKKVAKQLGQKNKVRNIELMKKLVPLYNKYKELGGQLKWNQFRRRYKEIGDDVFNEVNRQAEGPNN